MFAAKAGYTVGYSDAKFIESLHHINLPFLSKTKYRAFPVEGGSMSRQLESSSIGGKYIDKLSEIKNGRSYIILTRNDGIVYNRIFKKYRAVFILHSDNNQ